MNDDSGPVPAVRLALSMREGEMADVIYTATATSSGDGRNGSVRSAEGHSTRTRDSSSFGGPGGATNPEELFAAAYAVCFHNALRLVAKDKGVAIGDDSTVDVSIGIGPDETSFVINATITAHLPDMSVPQAQELLARPIGSPGIPRQRAAICRLTSELHSGARAREPVTGEEATVAAEYRVGRADHDDPARYIPKCTMSPDSPYLGAHIVSMHNGKFTPVITPRLFCK